MASKYDDYWKSQLAEVAQRVGEAYGAGTSSELDVSSIQELGDRGTWNGSFVHYPDGTTSASGAHAKSLGNMVLANGLLEPYRGKGFQFTVSGDLKLSVTRLDPEDECPKTPTLEDVLARIEALERRVSALEQRV